jgi:hypothetical protein
MVLNPDPAADPIPRILTGYRSHNIKIADKIPSAVEIKSNGSTTPVNTGKLVLSVLKVTKHSGHIRVQYLSTRP